MSDPFPDVDGIVIAPVNCAECGRTIYVEVERLREECSIRCAEHS